DLALQRLVDRHRDTRSHSAAESGGFGATTGATIARGVKRFSNSIDAHITIAIARATKCADVSGDEGMHHGSRNTAIACSKRSAAIVERLLATMTSTTSTPRSAISVASCVCQAVIDIDTINAACSAMKLVR